MGVEANCLSCILTFPCYQRMGIGRFLIQMNHELAQIAEQPGGPERPLSDLRLVAYRAYWRDALIKCFVEHTGQRLSVPDISQHTGMARADIVLALRDGGFLRRRGGEVVLGVTTTEVKEWRQHSRGKMEVHPEHIVWAPRPPYS